MELGELEFILLLWKCNEGVPLLSPGSELGGEWLRGHFPLLQEESGLVFYLPIL